MRERKQKKETFCGCIDVNKKGCIAVPTISVVRIGGCLLVGEQEQNLSGNK